jgi:hypothetical protein
MQHMTRYLISALACAALWGASGCLQPADEILEKSGDGSKMVFVKQPINQGRMTAMANNPDEFVPGTDLFLLSPISPTGKLTNLTEPFTRAAENERDWGAALDPEVSFDGTKIVFSMRKAKSRNWALYEMNVDGTDLVQLTSPTSGDDMDPAYLPDGRIVFTSTRAGIVDEYERRRVSQLHLGERGPEGNLVNIRPLSFNQSHDQNPFVHSSGKIFFSRWDHLGSPNKIPLFTIDPDGTNQFVLYGADETFGNNSPNRSGSRTFMEARELADGGLVSSLMDRASAFEGGAIALIDLSKFTDAPDLVTPSSSPPTTTREATEAIFKTPYPIMDGGRERLLVAQSPREISDNQGSADFGIYVMDKNGGNMRLIHNDTRTHDFDPIVIKIRALLPKIIADDPLVVQAMKQGLTTGTFFTDDVYSRMDGDGQMKLNRTHLNRDGSKGEAKYVRWLEAVSMPREKRGGTLGDTDFEKQRVIGYSEIMEDGSFSAEVPANASLHLQVLNEDGHMLVNQMQWIHTMPGERRVCTGCHGPREKDEDIQHFDIAEEGSVTFEFEDTRNYLASFANAQKVTEHRAARTDTIDFFDPRLFTEAAKSGAFTPNTNTVQTALERSCNECHGAGAASLGGGFSLQEIRIDSLYTNRDPISSVYQNLLRGQAYKARTGDNRDHVTNRGTRRSPLGWVLYNRQLSTQDGENLFRTSTFDHSTLWEKDEHGGIDLFAAENIDLRTLVEFMDMGAQFSNSVGY